MLSVSMVCLPVSTCLVFLYIVRDYCLCKGVPVLRLAPQSEQPSASESDRVLVCVPACCILSIYRVSPSVESDSPWVGKRSQRVQLFRLCLDRLTQTNFPFSKLSHTHTHTKRGATTKKVLTPFASLLKHPHTTTAARRPNHLLNFFSTATHKNRTDKQIGIYFLNLR